MMAAAGLCSPLSKEWSLAEGMELRPYYTQSQDHACAPDGAAAVGWAQQAMVLAGLCLPALASRAVQTLLQASCYARELFCALWHHQVGAGPIGAASELLGMPPWLSLGSHRASISDTGAGVGLFSGDPKQGPLL